MNGADSLLATLVANDVSVCFGNGWKWDPNCVDDEALKVMGHPLIIGGDHPLVSTTETSDLISKKIGSVINNNQ